METQGWFSVQEFAPGAFQVTEGEGNGFRFQSFLFLGERKALAVAVRNARMQRRYSGLLVRLRHQTE